MPLVLVLLLIFGVWFSPNIWNRPYELLEGEIHLPLSSFPQDLDIATAYNSGSYALLNQIVSPPLAYMLDSDGSLQVKPLALQHYHIDTNGQQKSYTLQIKKDQFFHAHPFFDNQTKAVRVDDFLFQIARMASVDYACPIKPQLRQGLVFFKELESRLKRIPLVDISFENLPGLTFDDDTIVIDVIGDFKLEQWLTLPFFAPFAREAEKQKKSGDFPTDISFMPIGNGNFYVNEVIQGEVIHLKSAKDIEPMHVHDVYFHADQESLSILQKFKSGYFDAISPNVKIVNQIFTNSSLKSYRQLWVDKKLKLHAFNEPTAFYLGFNMRSKNFDDDEYYLRIRKHISQSLNWNEFCEVVLDGLAHPSETFVPDSLIRADLRSQIISDTDMLIEENFLVNSQSLKMLYPKSSSPFAQRFKSWLIESMENIGIDLIIFEMDFADMHKTLEENEHDLFWAGWGADFPDPLNFYMLLYTNNSLLDFGGENITNYSNSKFDQLFEGFTGNNIITLEHLISKEVPLVPAFNPKSLILDHQWLHRETPYAFVNTPWSDYKVNSQVRAQYIEKENLVPKHYLYLLLILTGLHYVRKKARG